MNRKITNHGRNSQRGVTFIELLIGLLIIGIVVAVVAQKGGSVFAAKHEETIISDISALTTGAMKWKGIRPNYTGISCNTVVTYSAVGFSTCTGTNPLGGNYTITATGAVLTLTATGLTTDVCEKARRAIEPAANSATCTSGTLTVNMQG